MVTKEKDIRQASAGVQNAVSRLEVNAIGVASLEEWKRDKARRDCLKVVAYSALGGGYGNGDLPGNSDTGLTGKNNGRGFYE